MKWVGRLPATPVERIQCIVGAMRSPGWHTPVKGGMEKHEGTQGSAWVGGSRRAYCSMCSMRPLMYRLTPCCAPVLALTQPPALHPCAPTATQTHTCLQVHDQLLNVRAVGRAARLLAGSPVQLSARRQQGRRLGGNDLQAIQLEGVDKSASLALNLRKGARQPSRTRPGTACHSSKGATWHSR